MRQLFFIGLGFLVQWLTSPMFFGICGASDDPTKCLLIRGGIVFAVWIILNVIAGKKD